MKPLKISLRVWIALTSLFSFLGGWIFLSHSAKPAPLTGSSGAQASGAGVQPAADLPTLQPLPPLDSQLTSSGNQIQALPSISDFSANNFSPRLRTRGS